MFQLTRSPTAPARLIGRLAAEMVLHAIVATRRAFPAAFDNGSTYGRVALFLTLMRYAEPAFGKPTTNEQPRALSISSLAGSIRTPFETARRHVAVLVDQGLAERDRLGVRLAQDLNDDPRYHALLNDLHDLMVAQIDDLFVFSIPLPLPRPATIYRPAETLFTLLDTSLALLERNLGIYGSGMRAIVANAIIAANIRDVTYDPTLALRYARIDTVPPDALRRPVRTSALARGLHLPYSTVAREVRQMQDIGFVVRQTGGLVVPSAQLKQTVMSDNNRTALIRAIQIVQRLKLGGFPFDQPSQAYLRARAAPLAFE